MANWTIRSLIPARLAEPITPDRGGYTVTMRESSGADEVLHRLASGRDGEAPMDEARLHIGWGSFRNLDIAAARRSAWVLLLDINLHQFRVWQAVGTALRDPACADAEAFIELVVPLLPHQPRLRQFLPDTGDWLRADRRRGGSWLSAAHPGRFAHVRRLLREDRVTTACIDLRAPQTQPHFAELARRLAEAPGQGAVPDTLYVSNLPWMLAQREGFFGEDNAGLAANADTGVIDQVRANLALAAPHFRHVVEAGQLALSSREGDLQWETALRTPAAFLDPRYWSSLQPVSGAFRSLS